MNKQQLRLHNEMLAKIEQLQSINKELIEALGEIAEGKGRYSSDKFTHAINTIDDMKAIAIKALNNAKNL